MSDATSTSPRIPIAIPALVLGFWPSLERRFPDSSLTEMVKELLGDITLAVEDDPVIQAAISSSPELSGAFARLPRGMISPPPTESPPSSPEEILRAIATSPEIAELFGNTASRLYQAAGPSIRGFADAFGLYTSISVFLKDCFAPDRLDEVTDEIVVWVEIVLTPEFLPYVRPLLTPFLTSSALDILATPENLPALKQVVGSLVRGLLTEEAQPAFVGAARQCVIATLQAVSCDWDDDEFLDVKQAAGWLGIPPRTLHSRIRNYEGTPAAIPTERRTGKGYRGHGKLFIRKSDLVRWALRHGHFDERSAFRSRHVYGRR